MWLNNREKPGRPLPVIMLAAIFLGTVAPAQADSFLRVQKNGVIYYYFNNREELKNRPPAPATTRRAVYTQTRNKPKIQELEPLIQEAARQQNLPPSLVKAVIRVESNFNPAATSPKGAQGLMQLMPGTAADLQVADPYDIRENIWGGTRYLGMLLQKFNNRLPLALAAYNAGPKRVSACQQVPNIQETQVFVKNVCENFVKYNTEPAK